MRSCLAATILTFAMSCGGDSAVAGQQISSIEQLRRDAEGGDALAQFKMGVLRYDGQGAPKSYSEAARWFRLAADQGMTSAKVNLGKLLTEGKGVPVDHDAAAKWFIEA